MLSCITPFGGTRQHVVEFIGTFFLVLSISLIVQNVDGPFRPLAIGAVLLGLIYAWGYISKAQYNASVTIAMWNLGVFSNAFSVGFLIVEMAGGLCGALVGAVLGDLHKAPSLPVLVGTQAHAKAFLAELLFTFLLVAIILNVALSGQRGNQYFGVAIVGCVVSGIYAVGPISGASFNPCVTAALFAVGCAKEGVGCKWEQLILYTAAEVIAAFMANSVYRLTQETPEELNDRDRLAAEAEKRKIQDACNTGCGQANADLLAEGIPCQQEVGEECDVAMREIDGLCGNAGGARCRIKVASAREPVE